MKSVALLFSLVVSVNAYAESAVSVFTHKFTKYEEMAAELCPKEIRVTAKNTFQDVLNAFYQNRVADENIENSSSVEEDTITQKKTKNFKTVFIIKDQSSKSYPQGPRTLVNITFSGPENSGPTKIVVNAESLNYRDSAEITEGANACNGLEYNLQK